MQKLFTYPIQLDNVTAGEKKYTISPTPEQCREIEEILRVEKICSLSAEIKLSYDRKSGIARVSGKVEAEMEQISVISLEKFVKAYASEFAESYTTRPDMDKKGKETELNWEEDIPEPLSGGCLDLADVIIEQLALVMDYNPKKEGESFCFVSEFDEETDKKQNPFAVLEKIVKKS